MAREKLAQGQCEPLSGSGDNRRRAACATRSVGCISMNDLICAAKIEAPPRP